MYKIRYVQEKRPPEVILPNELERAITAYHEVLEARRAAFNLRFAPHFRPFSWPEEKEKA